MRKDRIHQIALYGVLTAFIVAMAFTPYLGYITVGVISFTTLHIIVIVTGLVLGKKGGTVAGAAFGITSFIQALISNTGLNIIFINPIVSIIPRILLGFCAGFLGEIIAKFYLKKEDKKAQYMILLIMGSAILTIIHTVLVVNLLFLFGYSNIIESGYGYISFIAIFLVGAAFEIVGAAIIAPNVTIALKNFSPLLKGKKENEEE